MVPAVGAGAFRGFKRRRRLEGVIAALLTSLLALTTPSLAEPRDGVITIYTAHIPPYVVPAEDGSLTGTLIEPVRRYAEANFDQYRIILLPWSSAYRRTLSDPDAMLFPVDRLPSREALFDWRHPLLANRYHLYALRGAVPETMTLDQVRADGRPVLCAANTAQCALLEEAGFLPSGIKIDEGTSVMRRVQMVLRQRSVFTVFDPMVYARVTARDGFDASRLVQLEQLGEVSSYLAANPALFAQSAPASADP